MREHARGKHLSAGRLAAHESELDRLHAELERVIANDFFTAKERPAALTAYEHGPDAISISQATGRKSSQTTAKSGALPIADYQGRRWLTRRNLHIDRLASAWLIKQFIDKRPRFYFVAEGETIQGAIPFDMFGAEFTQVFSKLHGLGHMANKILREIAEIVHDIDLKDDKFHRLEAPAPFLHALLGQ